ncbi:MAG TPA: HNH endonuclease signature motif containing protein [Alloacidobacterium sp.]|nr:HNH endonuclease signature motif containing protein [Alloacidobacterium sp.]
MTKSRHILPPRRYYTEAEIEEVRRLYADMSTMELARRLGRHVGSVYQLAARLGLKKSAAYLQSPAACRLRRGDNVGAACRFRPGHVPANKGLRRPGYARGRGRMEETLFKKGERHGIAARNWVPIGTRRVDAEGYWRIKVREWQPGEYTGFGNTKIWPLLQRHNWEKAHGPIPDGFAVCFKDGDRSRCDIDNLELVSRAELARRNRMWTRLPRELAEVIQLNGALKRKLRRKQDGEKQAGRPEESPVRDIGGAEGSRQADGPGACAGCV